MIEPVVSFLLKYKFILLFYLIIIILLLVKRKNIVVQAKIIFMYRMKWGLRWMDKYSQKFREWVILFGYVGVGAGFVGLVLISYTLIKNLYTLITVPEATTGVSLVLPGINVPGLGVLPFWHWLLAIFVIAIVHEFSHGIVARAHMFPVKNTGLVLFGPIIGAFVEPDEKRLRKGKDITQYSVLAAGAFSNIILALVAVLLLNFVFMPLQQNMVEPTGFTFDQYYDETYPFAQAGIQPGTLITGIDGTKTSQFQQFSEKLVCTQPGETISVMTSEKNYEIALTASPDNPQKSFLGIQQIRNEFEIKEKYKSEGWTAVYYSLDWLTGFLRWLFLLSLGIGLFNLLPLPIVDGGRMAQVFLHKLKGAEKGEKYYHKISLFFLLVLLLNLFYPWLVKLF
ncbi:site-2 protease family protein [Candidatus Woesearchaeota archaeon]|nr:site-2 protease family protein [Candidatus Woesearchaeota archaeon]